MCPVNVYGLGNDSFVVVVDLRLCAPNQRRLRVCNVLVFFVLVRLTGFFHQYTLSQYFLCRRSKLINHLILDYFLKQIKLLCNYILLKGDPYIDKFLYSNYLETETVINEKFHILPNIKLFYISVFVLSKFQGFDVLKRDE